MMDFHQASQAFVIIISLYVAHVASVSNVISDIQLTGGSKPNQGRLEVLQDGRFGVLCGNTWTDYNTEVVCRQLGFPGAVKFSTGTTPYAGDRDVITAGEFSCYGNETILSHCSSTSATCTRVLDVDITCQDFGYYGCYLRTGKSTADIYSFNDSRMANDLCIEGCKARGVNYYAILLETTCYCHISLEGLTRKDYDFPCSSLCPGNPEQSCGKGSDYFIVFRTDVGFCAEPEQQFLVDATKNSTRYGSIVEFKCATNSFELVGNKAIQCLGNSATTLEWDGEYPECIEKTFVSLGIALCAMGAIIVFLSMFFAVCCEIRRKLRKEPDGGDTEPLSSSITQDAIPNSQSNIQTHILQQERSDIGVSVVSASPLIRPLPREATQQATGRPHAHVGVPTVASPRTSGEYTGVYEELDDYISPGEDIGGGMDFIFERHPSEDQESSYEMSNLAAVGDIGQGEVGHLEIPSDQVEEEKDGYLEVRSDHGENKTGEHLHVLSAQPEGSDGYLEVLPDEGSGLPSTPDRPNTYIEVIDDEGAPGAKDRDSKEYTYIPDISEVANRPRHPDPQDHKVENQHEYDDTLVPPIYKNEKTMVPRPHRQDVGQ